MHGNRLYCNVGTEVDRQRETVRSRKRGIHRQRMFKQRLCCL